MRLSTTAGLEEWFAEKVTLVENNIFSFTWEGVAEQAKVVASKELKFIRFKWLEDDDPLSFFEFKITIDELTGDLSLVIIDYINEQEKTDVCKLWDKQVAGLKHVLGSN